MTNTDITFHGPWTRDERALDPGVRIRPFEVSGQRFIARSTLGPGYPLTVYPAGGPVGVSCTTSNDSDAELELAARRIMQF